MSGFRVLRRVLVANRGEIAVRVIRTCRRLGIETVLTVSEADVESLPARLADKVIVIGPAPAPASYLNADAIVGAAVAAGADAVHPGYGFLSENARLALACAAAGIVFIGPDPEVLEATGDKLAAREHAAAAGLPVLPGGHVAPGLDDLPEGPGAGAPATSRNGATAALTAATGVAGASGASSAAKLAGKIGYPVLVKAAGGGGGRGLRVVRDPAELAGAVSLASAEAGAAFGDPRVYLERYVERGRHVEVQLLGDGEHVIHLGDRDCSVQRRYQKLIEEAPAPGLDDGLRERLRSAAVSLGRRLRYRGAGTVEFLVDAGRGEFYFLEVNARVQVEHPVTEAITGIDIVAEQLALAEGRPLRLKQADVTLAGHAIEVRINAEDPDAGFLPSPGTVTRAVFPVGPAPAFSPDHEMSGDVAARSARHLPTGPTGPTGPTRPTGPTEPTGATGAGGAGPGSMRLGDDGAGTTEAGQIRAGSPSASSAGATGAGGIRVDTHVQAGATVPPYYDSLLAKVIAQAGDRDGALAVLRGALDRCVIDGVTTNLGLQRALLADPEFAAGGVDTGYLARRLARGLPGRDAGDPGRGPGADGHGTRPGEAPTVRDNAGPGPDARGGGDG